MIKVALVEYPSALKSALFGLEDMLLMANHVAAEAGGDESFQPQHLHVGNISSFLSDQFDYIFLPPSMLCDYYIQPEQALLNWLVNQREGGGRRCCLFSLCRGIHYCGCGFGQSTYSYDSLGIS